MGLEEEPTTLTPAEQQIAARSLRKIAEDPLLPSTTTLAAANLYAEIIVQEEI